MEMDAKSFRQSLRSQMMKHRQSLSGEQITQASQAIARTLNELSPVQKAKTIMGFAAIKNEIDLWPFMEEQRSLGKKILLPRVEGDQLIAVEWQGKEASKISSFGICEPLGPACPADEIDVVLVPGLVFDARGYRLGYGKGFYDRFLPLLRSNAFKCGIAYEFQVVDNVYPHAEDVALHWIVTDKSEILIDGDFF